MILVTGASGFVGQHLLRLLSKQGKKVIALYNNDNSSRQLPQLAGVSWRKVDLLDVFQLEEVMNEVEYVYHCAAIVSFAPSEKKNILKFNVEATANIVNTALAAGVRKLLFVSSIASLGRSTKQEGLINEQTEWEESNNNSVYSISKYFAEMEVWRGCAEGLDAVIVNPGIIIGEGDWRKGSAKLMQVVYDQFPYYTEGMNGFVDVQDVVTAMQMLMDSDVTAERFILTAGNFYYKDIFTQMANALNRKPPHIKAKKWMIGIVTTWSLLKSKIAGTEPTITPETARNAQIKSLYDNKKLLTLFPEFQYTPMQHTIERMANAFLNDQKK